MSIEKDNDNGFVLICDICGETIEVTDFQDGVSYKRNNNWKSQKEEDGDLVDVCPDCQ